jgi:hypothetical protein
MAKNNQFAKEGPRMAASVPAHRKSAEDILLDSLEEAIETAAEKMTDEEFKQAERKSSEILARALAAHSRRRGTA